jgi:hypothetical protein
MEPLLIVLVPGVLGGIILAVLLGSRWIDLRTRGADRRLAPTSPSLINMAHIPVQGGGGLGIVAAVIAVGLADSRIRGAIGIAALLGVVLAAVLIARRRERGPLSSGGSDSASPSLLGLGREKPGRAAARSNGGGNHLSAGRTGGAGFRLVAGH